MSTHGAIGIRMNGVDKVGYNHFDSYPTGLGDDVLVWLKGNDLTRLKKVFDEIKFTDDDEKDAWNWDNHCLNKIFEDRQDFLYNSLICEFAYIVNLDTNMLEYYVGFNKDLNAPGRYSNFKNKDSVCYGVRLEKEIPLNDLFEGKYEAYEYDDNDTHEEGFRFKGNK